jgi:hypothetical protein
VTYQKILAKIVARNTHNSTHEFGANLPFNYKSNVIILPAIKTRKKGQKMDIRHTETYGFSAAIRGMRNPMSSWEKGDSILAGSNFRLGEKDMELSQKLTKAGSEHCKHLQLIAVWFDVEAPRYWFTEFDTYKFKSNISTSTMHTLMKNPVQESNFSKGNIPAETIAKINSYIEMYRAARGEAEKAEYLVACKSILPEGFLCTRTVCTNYQTLLNMYGQRKTHRLPEWQYFCKWILGLPYFRELTGIKKEEKL